MLQREREQWNLTLNSGSVLTLMHITWSSTSLKVIYFLSPSFTCQDKCPSSLQESTVWFSNQFDKSSENCKTVLEQIMAWHSALTEKIWLKTDVLHVASGFTKKHHVLSLGKTSIKVSILNTQSTAIPGGKVYYSSMQPPASSKRDENIMWLVPWFQSWTLKQKWKFHSSNELFL